MAQKIALQRVVKFDRERNIVRQTLNLKEKERG